LWTRFFETSWTACKLREPAAQASIEKYEDELNVPLPLPLQQLFRETDGVLGPDDEYLIFPLEELVDCNVELWLGNEYESDYLPLESFLFFGTDSLRNLFAYPILGDRPDKSKVFRWRRDNDSRMYYANGLEQYFYMRWKCFEENNLLLWDQSLMVDANDFQRFLNSSDEADFSPGGSADMSG